MAKDDVMHLPPFRLIMLCVQVRFFCLATALSWWRFTFSHLVVSVRCRQKNIRIFGDVIAGAAILLGGQVSWPAQCFGLRDGLWHAKILCLRYAGHIRICKRYRTKKVCFSISKLSFGVLGPVADRVVASKSVQMSRCAPQNSCGLSPCA